MAIEYLKVKFCYGLNIYNNEIDANDRYLNIKCLAMKQEFTKQSFLTKQSSLPLQLPYANALKYIQFRLLSY